jgi:DNA-binding transcriptional LysR family regulator
MSTLRQLAYWLAVVDEGSFTRAAQIMHVSQPSLSQQIRALERQVGGDLLERLPRGVRLTTAGQAFLPHARSAVRHADGAMRSARTALQLEIGELEISTVRSIAVGLLPELIMSWRQRYPGTVVRLHEHTHRRLVEEAVREGLADIGIGPPPPNWTGCVESLGWEEFVIVLPADDPLAARLALPIEELADREWIMFDTDNGLCDMLAAACTLSPGTSFDPKQAVITSQVETASRLAAAGVGPTFVPRNTIPHGLPGAVLSCIPPVGRELTVYARSEWGPLAEAFVALAQGATWKAPLEDALTIP